jgi:hypothetical protein
VEQEAAAAGVDKLPRGGVYLDELVGCIFGGNHGRGENKERCSDDQQQQNARSIEMHVSGPPNRVSLLGREVALRLFQVRRGREQEAEAAGMLRTCRIETIFGCVNVDQVIHSQMLRIFIVLPRCCKQLQLKNFMIKNESQKRLERSDNYTAATGNQSPNVPVAEAGGGQRPCNAQRRPLCDPLQKTCSTALAQL